MVRLDLGRRAGARLDDIGVERSLNQECRLADLARLLFEDADELLTDYLAFVLGLRNPREFREKALLSVDVHQRHVEVAAEGAFDLLAFVFPHEAMVHEDACELVAHRFVGEQRGYRGIDAPGQAAHHALASHLLADAFDGVFDDGDRRPRRGDIADLVEKVLEDVLAVRRVLDLGMELHAVQPAGRVFHGGHRHVGAGGRNGEPFGDLRHRVAVAHPAGQFYRHAVEERRLFGDGEWPPAVLGRLETGNSPAAHLGHELQAVADA